LDRIALETSVSLTLVNGMVIRHASAAAFLGLKWAAFADRGAADPFGSRDLEDILALVASRPSLLEEVRVCPSELKLMIVGKTSDLLADGRLPDLLAGHLNNAQSPARVSQRVRERLTEIAGLKSTD
jgi:hypothetical protein